MMLTKFAEVFASNLRLMNPISGFRAMRRINLMFSPLLHSATHASSDHSGVTFKERTSQYLLSDPKYQTLYNPKPELSYSKLKELKKQLDSTKLSNTKISINEVLQLLKSLKPEDHINVNYVDKLAASKLCECTQEETLLLSLLGLKILGNMFDRGEFYSCLLQNIEDYVDRSNTHQDLIVWAYMSSLSKRNKALKVQVLRKIYERFKTQIEFFNLLNPLETSILCNAWFANGIFVTSKPMLRRIDGTLLKQITSEQVKVSQEALSMLKILRRGGFASDGVLQALANTVESNCFENLNMAEATHALALLADHRYALSDAVVENLASLIEQNKTRPIQGPTETNYHPTRRTRVKDITRFMWALSCLASSDHPSSHRIAANVIEMLNSAWKTGSFRLSEDCHLLSDFFLSLACWNIYPENLIKNILSPAFVEAVINQRQSVRQSRLALFLAAAQIEAPHLQLPESYLVKVSTGLRTYRIEKELGKRILLANLAGYADRHREKLGWEDIQCGSQIPHLNIAGLTFSYEGRKIGVEVLDTQVCMRRTSQPERLLSLKIRLLEKQGYHVYQLKVNEANNRQREAEVQGDNQIDQYLFNLTEWLKNKRFS